MSRVLGVYGPIDISSSDNVVKNMYILSAHRTSEFDARRVTRIWIHNYSYKQRQGNETFMNIGRERGVRTLQ